MKWIGELYIIQINEGSAYRFDNSEPDAFVEAETKREAYIMLASYDLTMGENKNVLIYVHESEQGE